MAVGHDETGPDGLVHPRPGRHRAGPRLALVGLLAARGQAGPFFVWQNSWGSGYGDGGLGFIHHRDLARLLAGSGEAAIPTREAQR